MNFSEMGLCIRSWALRHLYEYIEISAFYDKMSSRGSNVRYSTNLSKTRRWLPPPFNASANFIKDITNGFAGGSNIVVGQQYIKNTL